MSKFINHNEWLNTGFVESDDVFKDNNLSIFYAVIRIQLIEFLVVDYLLEWSKAEDFDNGMLHTLYRT